MRDEERSIVKNHLKLSGVVRREGSTLVVRNLIYREVFDEQWVRAHLPATSGASVEYVAVAHALHKLLKHRFGGHGPPLVVVRLMLLGCLRARPLIADEL